MREEYHVEVADLVASGSSAFKQFFDEASNSKTEGPDGVERESASGRETVRFDEVRGEIDARVKRLQRKLKMVGYVDSSSLRQLDELERRFGRLSAQLQDLVEAKAALEEIVRKINVESRRLFTQSFETIRGHFREILRRLFGGGEGEVVLECGIDIVSRPPGKELRSISLLSGGEKTLTAVGLLLAIFQSRPSPFCILDEVDAALDEANVDRYLDVLRDFQSSTQFIVITHSKRTMAAADVLYGVTMEQSGVSKRMSVRFEDVSASGELTGPPLSEIEDAA
jgi:chromosome segregation protein